MSSLLNPFAGAAARSVAAALSVDADVFTVSAPPKPELGDFAVGCFPAAKLLGESPAKLAERAAAAFTPDAHLTHARATGPFVNFRADRPALFRTLASATLSSVAEAPALIPAIGAGKTIAIDYSSPNISKHLAYHHIRSTVLGQVLKNLYAALGYRAVGINHLGDWGTTHGMLLAAVERFGLPEPLDIAALNQLYVRYRSAIETDPSLEDAARAWFARLEGGDAEARALWQRFRDVSWAEFAEVYSLLGVDFDEVRGESAYQDAMAGVMELLAAKNLVAESEGAKVVHLEDVGIKTPLLLEKQDGTTLYATRDIAAALYRWQTYQFEKSLYVVDRGQSLHFQQLFATLAKAELAWAARCEHIAFGLVRMGGKKTGTRSGRVILLREVLDQAIEKARAIVRENNPDMPDAELEVIARQVGLGGVMFFNLSSQREKDVDFDLETVISTKGDTGPYLQYAHARCASILRKADLEPSSEADFSLLTSDAEWRLARRLIELGEVVAGAAASSEPHHLSRYLLDVCALYSAWYTAGNGDASLRVLCDDRATRAARVALVGATKGVLRRGLALLNIEAPDQM